MNLILKVKDWIKYQAYTIELKERGPLVDPKTGNINIKYNPLNIQEDYYLYTRAEPTEEESISFTPKQN